MKNRWRIDTEWDPTNLGSELVAWYDANDASTISLSGSDVTQWNDKSGNGLHLTPGQSPDWGVSNINGLDCVDFSGTFNRLLNTTASVDCTEVCILSIVEGRASGDQPSCGWVEKTDQSDVLHGVIGSAGPTSGRAKATITVDSAGGTAQGAASASLADDIPLLFTAWYDGADGVVRGNGGETSNTITSPTDAATFTINTIGTGRRPTGGNTPRNKHGEMLVLSTSDTDTVELVEGYLAHKWGTVANLDASHPYKSGPPTV